MKLITRNTDYAIRALCYIADKKDKVSVSDLVRNLKIPRAFLRKLLQILNREGILKSFKGSSGGFLLAKSAEKIFLVDLIEILQGPFEFNECIFKKNICSDIGTCLLRQKLNRIEKQVISDLKTINVASLIN